MTNWYVEISDYAPESFKCDKYLSTVIDTASPCMNYFCRRLSELKDWRLEDANNIFKEIVEELPVMQAHIWNDEFSIKYNKHVYIRLTETSKQIYRESKLNKILNDKS